MTEISVRQILAALIILAAAGSHDAMIARRSISGRQAANLPTVRIAHFEAASANNALAPSASLTSHRESPVALANRGLRRGDGASPRSDRVSHPSMNIRPMEYRTRP